MRRACRAVLVSAALIGCEEAPDDPPSSPAGATVEAPTLWRTLGTWEGSGARQTESFDVSTGSLRLAWEATDRDAAGPGHLRVSLHSAISGRPLATVVDTRGSGTGSEIVTTGPRVAYLRVDSEATEWRIELAEGAAPR